MSPIPSTMRAARAPRFDVDVPRNGYRWWYVDGLSDDGESGIVVIAFVGSVFSPYYYRARTRGPVDPHEHCAINVGLYRPNGKLWAMTERGSAALERGATWFRVGPSSLEWRGERLVIEITERSAPFGRRMSGTVTLVPEYLNRRSFDLDDGGRHRWRPVSPSARIEVDMRQPSLSWRGHGYMDTNAGERPLEDDFCGWTWSRSNHRSETSITYAVTQLDREERALAIRFDRAGVCHDVDVPSAVSLPGTGWRIGRATLSHATPSVLRTLEDTPFYARSLLQVREHGVHRLVMHESLALDRFTSGWVRLLLPFRMPRRT